MAGEIKSDPQSNTQVPEEDLHRLGELAQDVEVGTGPDAMLQPIGHAAACEVIAAVYGGIRAQAIAEVRERLEAQEPKPYDRERFTVGICPKCGGRNLLRDEHRKHGGRYCYCHSNKGEGTRCEEIEVVAISALDAALNKEDSDD
jgi:hypothetical protein